MNDEENTKLETLRQLITNQFANFPIQKLLNEALNFVNKDEELMNAFNKILLRLTEAIEQSTESAQKSTVHQKWLTMIQGYKKGEKSSHDTAPASTS